MSVKRHSTCVLYYSFSENKGADQLQGSASLFSYYSMQNVVFLLTRLIVSLFVACTCICVNCIFVISCLSMCFI